jgi:hypothetical protein
MKRLKFLAAALAAAITAGQLAAENGNAVPDSAFRARIDVDGLSGKTAMKPVKNCGESGWMGEDKIFRMTSDSGPLKDTEWKNFEISFTPEDDGNVSLCLMGQCFTKQGEKTGSPVWVLFTDVKISGAELKNGSFSELEDTGAPKFWGGGGNLVDIKDPAPGKAIRVWHDRNVCQQIAVKAGQTVTVTAKVQKAQQ